MSEAMLCASGLLARREYSARELAEKLGRKGYDPREIAEVLLECQRLGLQSDGRFAESICRVRTRQGYGPLRIIQELQSKGLGKDLIAETCDAGQKDWEACALDVLRKKFKTHSDLTRTEIQKRQRFLLYRGFPAELAARMGGHADLELL